MSNIILTTDCQRKCKYCFAKDNIDKPMSFQMGNFIKTVDWLTKDNNITNRVGLLGGEPTLHPRFIEFLDYLLSKKLNTLIFTNGMVEEKDILEIVKIANKNKVKHMDHLCFCVNVNEEKYRSQKEQRLQTQFLKILGRVSVPSFNIFEENCDFGFLVDLINKYNTVRNIRFGLASPLGNRNNFMELDGYKAIGDKLTEFTSIRKKHKIKIGLDCGFPKCMFTEEQRKLIIDSPVDNFSFGCGPSIDIYPDLTVASCYPLSRIKKVKMEDWPSYNELFQHLGNEVEELEPIYNKCYDCDWFADHSCSGGCKAHKING